jgi:hypothetical protein
LVTFDHAVNQAMDAFPDRLTTLRELDIRRHSGVASPQSQILLPPMTGRSAVRR